MVITIMMVIMVMIVRSWPRELCFDIDTKTFTKSWSHQNVHDYKKGKFDPDDDCNESNDYNCRIAQVAAFPLPSTATAGTSCSRPNLLRWSSLLCLCLYFCKKQICLCLCPTFSSNCLLNLNTQKHIHARTQTQNYITQLQRMSSTLKQREKPKLRQLLSDIQTPTCCPELTVLLASASCCSSSPFSTDSNYDICIIVAVLVLLLQTLILTSASLLLQHSCFRVVLVSMVILLTLTKR